MATSYFGSFKCLCFGLLQGVFCPGYVNSRFVSRIEFQPVRKASKISTIIWLNPVLHELKTDSLAESNQGPTTCGLVSENTGVTYGLNLQLVSAFQLRKWRI